MLEAASANVEQIKLGARLELAETAIANRVLGRLERASRDLTEPGLGAAAEDAGKSEELRAVRAKLETTFLALRERVETAPNGDLEKCRKIAKRLVSLADRVLMPSRGPMTIGALLVVPLNRELAAFAEKADAYYTRGAQSRTHFAKVLYSRLAMNEVDFMKGRAKDNPEITAFAHSMAGMISQHLFGGNTDALELYHVALEKLGGYSASVQYNIAAASSALGKNAEAIDALQKAVKQSTTPSQAEGLLAMAAHDPGMWHLVSEPKYHELLESVGGTKLTQMEGVVDHHDRPLHQTRGWMYHLPGSWEPEQLEVEFAQLPSNALGTPGTGVRLQWGKADFFEPGPPRAGGRIVAMVPSKGDIIAERISGSGESSHVVLGQLTKGPGRWEITLNATDRLVFDPAELHRFLATFKLRDAPVEK
jgi:hypothetical protein